MGEEHQEEELRLEKGHCHTRKWFLENYGVDPLKLTIPFKEIANPHYRLAPPMKLWNEKDVSPYSNRKSYALHRVRSEAAKKGAETRRRNLIAWFEQTKSSNRRVSEIIRRLWDIGNKISELHMKKEKCRKGAPRYGVEERKDYFEYYEEHCANCAKMTEQQNTLRYERERLFEELECISGKDKQTIQLARRYLRERMVKGPI